MIPPARIVVLITACSPFQGSKQTYYRKRAKLLDYGKVETAFTSYDEASVYGRVGRAPHHPKDI